MHPPRTTLFPYTTLFRSVFPDQLACPENLVGDREIPDHPLVNQTIADCLLEAMDFPGLKRVIGDRKSTRLNSSHPSTSYAVFCLKKNTIESARAMLSARS